MIECLGATLIAGLVGVLVLARSMPLGELIQGRQKVLAHSSAFFTALFAAAAAGLAAFLVLSSLIK